MVRIDTLGCFNHWQTQLRREIALYLDMPAWISEVTGGMFQESITHLSMQPSHPGYPSSLLEGIDADTLLDYHFDELLMDVVQHFAIHFQSLDDLLVRVLQR